MSQGGFHLAAHQSVTLVEKPQREQVSAAESQASPAPLLLSPLPRARLRPPRPPRDSLATLTDEQCVGKPALVHTVQQRRWLPSAEGSGRPRPSFLA